MKPIDTKTPFAAIAESRIGGRSENQDTCAWQDTPFGLLILVCDGMGGGPSGKYASQLAAATIVNFVLDSPSTSDRRKVIKDAIEAGARKLIEAQAADPHFKGMGTTVAALLINRDSAIVAHVGDSRVYQLRGTRKIFRTFDHSQVFELVKAKVLTEEEARVSKDSNIITQALGPMEHVKPAIVELPYEKGDRFMLCTDGIWGALPEKEIIGIAGGTKNLSGAVESLAIKVDETGRNEGGHHDNLTLAILQTPFNSNLKQKMSTRARYAFIALSVIACVSLIFNFIQLGHSHKLVENQAAVMEGDSLVTKTEFEKILKNQEREMQEQIDYYNKKIKEIESNLEKKEKQEVSVQTKEILEEIEIVNQINIIISDLEEIENIKTKGEALNKAVDATKTRIDQLSKDITEHNINIAGTDFQKCINQGWIGNALVKDPGHQNHASHIKAIIKAMKSLKQQIQTQQI